MNQEESAADKYLRSLSSQIPIFEPEGYKKPPDFSLPSGIGVEVRRLNQNYLDAGDPVGLEEDSIPLHATLKRVLESFDTRFDGHSYWVGISFKRPFRAGGKRTAQEMTAALDLFLKGSRETPFEVQVNGNVQFDIRVSGNTIPGRVFRHAITTDDDNGGCVVQMYIDNIAHCIQQKERKIAPIKGSYREIWLVLVDTMMAWNLEPYEVDEIRKAIREFGSFNRILVIDYFGDNCLLEFIA